MQDLNNLNTPKKANWTLAPFRQKRVIQTEPVYFQCGKWKKIKDLNKKKGGK